MRVAVTGRYGFYPISEEHTCAWVDRSRGNLMQKWDVRSLWTAALGLKAFDLDITKAQRKCNEWIKHLPNTKHPLVRPELSRIEASDLSFPIILHPQGWIMDGNHRVAKAILADHTAIRTVQFTEGSLPLPTMEIPGYVERPAWS